MQSIIDGTKTGNSCFQSHIEKTTGEVSSIPQSEDCLVLNVWTKCSTNGLKPVMFWIHGGSLFRGSSFDPKFNGSILALNDVVVVTINYRLGPFGWLYSEDESAPGNAGLYDQLFALKWVCNGI